jgi:elongation factor Ts
MANYTAADVKKLRELTGSGMMDCKKALEEAGGDLDKAVEILRIKGAKDVGKRAGRTTANGLVAHSGTALLEINCETDFVAKNADFVALGDRLVAHVAQARPADVEALLASSLSDGRTVAQTVEAESARIGEKLVVSRFAVLDGQVAVYMHRKSPDLPPQVGVAVQYAGKSDEAGEADARAVAMQIAAMRPEVPHPRGGARRTSWSPSGASPRRPRARRASPRRPCPRSSRVGSTPSSRTSSCWSRRRWPTTRRP